MAKNDNKFMQYLVVAVVLGLIVSGGFFLASRNTAVTQATSCDIEPYIDLSVNDAVNQGTAISSLTLNYALIEDGVEQFKGSFTSGSSGTKFNVGDKVKLIVEKANYIAFVSDEIEIESCGKNSESLLMYATDDSTLQIKNSVGNVVTDASTGGATNQSSASTNIDMEWKITGNSDKSSGNLLCVFEASNTTVVDDIVLSGAGEVDVPEFYTVAGASAIAKAYDVDALVDGDSRTYNLRFVPESGKTIADVNVLTTCYSEQAFKDTDGSFVVGVEDTDGTNKYEDDFDYDFYIQP